MRSTIVLASCLVGASLLATTAHAVRGGRVAGARVSASTTFRPTGGVTSSVTVAAGRYHAPTTRPVYGPGVAYPGQAIRTTREVARSTARRVAYRTAAGYSYYYGAAVSQLPSPSCYAVLWEGMSAYNCGGIVYIYEDSQYYAIEGA